MKPNTGFAFILSIVMVGCSSLSPQSPERILSLNALSECAGVVVEKKVPSLTIMITAVGDYYIQIKKRVEGKTVEDGFYLKDRGSETLKSALAQTISKLGKLPVYIEADRDSRFQSYVTVMDKLRQLGLYEVTIVTVKDCKCPSGACSV